LSQDSSRIEVLDRVVDWHAGRSAVFRVLFFEIDDSVVHPWCELVESVAGL
jgi:hypothetical protein